MSAESIVEPDGTAGHEYDSCRFNTVNVVSDGQEIRLSLPSNRDVISPVITMLRDTATATGVLSEEETFSLSLALAEALTNAVVHGNLEISSKLKEKNDGTFERLIAQRSTHAPYVCRRVEVTATYTSSEASFVISDEGPGFEVSSIPDPTEHENLHQIHGRGLFLMRSFMDEVKYNSRGNQVTLVKRKHHCSELAAC